MMIILLRKVEHEEAELNGNPSFKFIIKFKILNSRDWPVNVEMETIFYGF